MKASAQQKFGCLALVLLLLMCAAASGQPTRTQLGQALDANPLIGSGGLNPQVRGFRAFDAQRYVNRQVSGLGAFSGNVGYFPADELRLELPSDTLSTFRRQSVGLADVASGRTYAPAPYFDPARTAWRAGGIIAGRNVTPVGRTGGAEGSAAVSAFVDARVGGLSLTPGASTKLSGLPGGRGDIPQIRAQSGLAKYLEQLQFGSSPRAADVTMFGSLSRRERDRLAGQLANAALRDEQLGQVLDSHRLPDAGTVTATSTNEQLRTGGESEKSEISPAAWAPQESQAQAEQVPIVPPITSDQLTTASQTQRDILAALMEYYGVSKRPDSKQTAENADAGPGDQELTPLAPARGRPGPGGGGTASNHGLFELRPSAGIVLHSLAGNQADRFSRAMRKAQQQLKEGRYYQAIGNYQLATTLAPANPLARVGMALASFAAGETHSAALQLRRAIRIYKDVLVPSVDVAALMGERVFVSRLDALDQKLAEAGDRVDGSLVLLAAVMHHWAGQDAKARALAGRLRGDPDESLRSCAMYLLSLLPASGSAATTLPTGG